MRNPTIDILRAVAVLLVFCRHSEGALLLSHFGWIGVDLFFVLSGFLVSGLLFHEYQTHQSIRPGRFLMRRGFKIYPQFYLFLVASLAVKFYFAEPAATSELVAEAAFFQNYTTGVWAHTWSLGVEEHFYILLILAILWLARRGGEDPFAGLPKFAAILCGMILTARIVTWVLIPEGSNYVNVFPSHLRMDSLLTGVVLSYYHAFHRAGLQAWVKRYSAWLQPASIALLAPVAFLQQYDPMILTLGFSMTAWAFVILLAVIVVAPKPTAPLGRFAAALAKLGQVSYAFYLWHGLVLFSADRMLPGLAARGIAPHGVVLFAATFTVTLAIAFLTTWLVEVPLLRLRDRWVPSGAKPRAIQPNDSPESAPPVLA